VPKLTPADKAKFHVYVQDVDRCIENLAFLLDNLNEKVTLDGSMDSLAKAEAVYWRHVDNQIPTDLSDSNHFAQLLGQYLGRCIIQHTGARWVQCEDPNPMFGQPCIDGFGGKEWDRIYPVHVALHLRNLPHEKPHFPGVRERRVLATKLETAMALHAETKASKQRT